MMVSTPKIVRTARLAGKMLIAFSLLVAIAIGTGCGFFMLEGGQDAGVGDATTTLADASVDSGAVDSGVADSSVADGVVVDSSVADGVVVDSSVADGVVVDSSVADSGVADSGGPDVGPPSLCGTVSLIHDNFDDNSLSDQWEHWGYGATQVVERNSRLEIPLADDSYANIYSAIETSLIDDRISVQLVQPAEVSFEGEAIVHFWSDDDNLLGLRQSGDTLTVEEELLGSTSTWPFPFDSVQQQWWSIREQGGRVYFETSPDGSNWTYLHDVATPRYIMRALVIVGGGTWGYGSNGTVIFDNLNVGRPAADWCPAATFDDNFNDNSNSLWWRRDNGGGCTATESNDEMLMSATHQADCYSETAHPYLLAGSSVVVELLGGTLSPDCVFAGLVLKNWEADWSLWFGLEYGTLAAWESSTGDVPWIWDDQFRWLRVSESGGVLTLAAQGAGGWVSLPPIRPTVAIDPVVVSLNLDAQGCPQGTQPVSAAFDNYNLGPN